MQIHCYRYTDNYKKQKENRKKGLFHYSQETEKNRFVSLLEKFRETSFRCFAKQKSTWPLTATGDPAIVTRPAIVRGETSGEETWNQETLDASNTCDRACVSGFYQHACGIRIYIYICIYTDGFTQQY